MVMITCDKEDVSGKNRKGEVLRRKYRRDFNSGSRPAPRMEALLK
jgi:hypothetical protein